MESTACSSVSSVVCTHGDESGCVVASLCPSTGINDCFIHGGTFLSFLITQSAILICRHDNQDLTLAHLFQRSRQGDQVGITVVTSFPQVEQYTCGTWLGGKVVQVPVQETWNEHNNT